MREGNHVTLDALRRFEHAQRGMIECLKLPRLGFYDPASVYVVRVQIDLEHLERLADWSAEQVASMAFARRVLASCLGPLEERQQDVVRARVHAALTEIACCGVEVA